MATDIPRSLTATRILWLPNRTDNHMSLPTRLLTRDTAAFMTNALWVGTTLLLLCINSTLRLCNLLTVMTHRSTKVIRRLRQAHPFGNQPRHRTDKFTTTTRGRAKHNGRNPWDIRKDVTMSYLSLLCVLVCRFLCWGVLFCIDLRFAG